MSVEGRVRVLGVACLGVVAAMTFVVRQQARHLEHSLGLETDVGFHGCCCGAEKLLPCRGVRTNDTNPSVLLTVDSAYCVHFGMKKGEYIHIG